MASSETSQVSSLPLPPAQYISQYTDENVRRGRIPRPPPPIHDTYSMFGNSFNADDAIIRPLENQVSTQVSLIVTVRRYYDRKNSKGCLERYNPI